MIDIKVIKTWTISDPYDIVTDADLSVVMKEVYAKWFEEYLIEHADDLPDNEIDQWDDCLSSMSAGTWDILNELMTAYVWKHSIPAASWNIDFDKHEDLIVDLIQYFPQKKQDLAELITNFYIAQGSPEGLAEIVVDRIMGEIE